MAFCLVVDMEQVELRLDYTVVLGLWQFAWEILGVGCRLPVTCSLLLNTDKPGFGMHLYHTHAGWI